MPDLKPEIRRKIPFLLAAAVIAGLLAIEFFWPAPSAENPPDSAAPVAVVRVSRQDLHETYQTIGTVAGLTEVRIVSQVEGILTATPVRPGDRVRTGQTLASLDDRLLRAELAQAEAAARRSTEDLDRVRRLAELEIVETARLEAAIAQQAIDQAAADRLRTQISLGRFPSPLNGVVTTQYAYPGDTIQKGSALFGLAEISRLRVIAKLPEDIAARLAPGMSATVRTDESAVDSAVTVMRVYPAADPVSHQTTVELDAGPAFPSLQPGFLVRVRLVLVERPSVLALDRRAVPDAMPGDMVRLLLVRDGRAESRAVQIGAVGETHVEIAGGLAEGDMVIWRGGSQLTAGDPVRLIEGPGAAE
jgi:membrane fusion protein (multidrug efflux system)